MIRFPCRWLLAALLAFPAIAAFAESAMPSFVDVEAAGFRSRTLANGFKIILAPFPSAPDARLELVVRTGSLHEGYGETGMAHLLEHMLFKSAGPRADVKSDLTRIGARWNGTTTADRTNYFETIEAEPEKIDEALRIEADRFIRASFTREHLASEMTVVRNEMERGAADPGSALWQAVQRLSFPWHGYGRATIGARSDVEGAPFEALQAFHRKHYRPDNAFLVVSGKFDAEHVMTLATQLFAAAVNPPAPKISTWTREEARAMSARVDLTMPAGRSMAMSAWKIPAYQSREAEAFDLAISAICSGDWGSLRREVVIERKQAVAAGCSAMVRREAGLFIASATGNPEDDPAALSSALIAHIEKAAAAGITAEQLERAKAEEINAYENLASNHGGFAALLSTAEVAGDWRLVFVLREYVAAITVDEANAALRRWVVPLNRVDALVRHGDAPPPPAIPVLDDPAPLVRGRNWPVVAKDSDPVPSSSAELAKATVKLPVDANGIRAEFIPRRNQGDLAWIVFANDYGNQAFFNESNAVPCTLLGNLMGRGGAGLDRDALTARLEALQAKAEVTLSGVSVRAPRKYVLEAFSLLLSVWAEPLLPAAEFEQFKAGAIASGGAQRKDPAAVAAALLRLRFDNFPPGHPSRPYSIERSIELARAATVEQARECHGALKGVGPVRLALVGPFTEADVRAVGAQIARLPRATLPYARIEVPDSPTEVDTTPIVVAMPGKPNASVAATASIPIRDDDPDFPALRIAIQILGGNSDSRIWQRLREREGLAYGAGAALSGSVFEKRSTVSLYASAASNQAETARDSLAAELATALRDGFTEAEVERARQAWLQARALSLKNESGYASALAGAMHTGRDYAWNADYEARLARVTAKDASEALRRHLGPARFVWMIGKGSDGAPAGQ